MHKPHSWFRRRRRTDVLMEELVTALSTPDWSEFNPLFLRVYASLRARKGANGGEEMLRLRLYDKLQNLVQMGGAEKDGKSYRGIETGLALVTKHLAADHCSELLAVVRCEVPAPLS